VTLRPEPGGVVASLLAAATQALPESLADHRIVGIGWATVDLERAAAQLDPALALPADGWTPATRDQLLGATALLGPWLALTPGPALGPDGRGPRLVLLEPDTEGRLAASLARHGEGVAVVYVTNSSDERGALVPTHAGGSPGTPARSSVAPGPLGRGRLLLGGPISGPHVVVLEAPPNSESLPSAGD